MFLCWSCFQPIWKKRLVEKISFFEGKNSNNYFEFFFCEIFDLWFFFRWNFVCFNFIGSFGGKPIFVVSTREILRVYSESTSKRLLVELRVTKHSSPKVRKVIDLKWIIFSSRGFLLMIFGAKRTFRWAIVIVLVQKKPMSEHQSFETERIFSEQTLAICEMNISLCQFNSSDFVDSTKWFFPTTFSDWKWDWRIFSSETNRRFYANFVPNGKTVRHFYLCEKCQFGENSTEHF